MRIILALTFVVPSPNKPLFWTLSGPDFRRAIQFARSRPNPVAQQIRAAVGKLKKK